MTKKKCLTRNRSESKLLPVTNTTYMGSEVQQSTIWKQSRTQAQELVYGAHSQPPVKGGTGHFLHICFERECICFPISFSFGHDKSNVLGNVL